MHAETPDVRFGYKYLLLAELDPYEEPVVCTTFQTYKENGIEDHCTLIKVSSSCITIQVMRSFQNQACGVFYLLKLAVLHQIFASICFSIPIVVSDHCFFRYERLI